MVEYVEKWRLNNYTSSRGRPVVNADLLRGLDGCLTWLEEEKGVDMRFWHVPREQNMQADKLANAALDGVDYKQFTQDDLFD
jgi:ribonuclease HI